VGPGGFAVPDPGPTPPGFAQPGFAQPPAAAYGAQHTGPPPNNGLVWAILAAVLCCLPTGIAAIVYASQVESKWYRGDQAGARRSAELARTWTWVSVAVGVLTVLVFWVLPIALSGVNTGT
jgi:hypothetical protein